MLVEYSFKNFCSFKEETKITLQSTEEEVKDKFPDNYYSGKKDVLKSAVIVGENAGGKSNFIKSLKYLKSFFKENRKVESAAEYINDDYTEGCRYKDTTQKFSLTVLLNDTFYFYELVIDFLGVKYEQLEILKESELSRKTFFEVTREEKEPNLNDVVKRPSEFKFSDLSYEVKVNQCEKKTTVEDTSSIGLNMTRYALLGVEEALAFSQWINNTLIVESALYEDSRVRGSYFQNLEDWRVMNDSRFIDILRIIDASIVAIKPDQRLPYQDTIITRKNSDGKIFNRELRTESAGIRDYFAWAIQIFKVIYENKVLFADEMDRSFNPILADKIISLIQGSTKKGQFIFTTHNVLHLNLDNYMKEQIYFVTKNIKSLYSEMYSLSEFSQVEYEMGINLYEFYLRGVLGGTMSE